MQCPRCQHENPATVKFCGECGARLDVACSACRTPNPPANKFCHECGAPMGSQPAAGLRSSPETHAIEPASAERRQLTVMFCDLVGSTELSRKLDPEALRKLLQVYQRACGEAVDRYAGHVAQYLGDGLMVYFGWPRAHEDDAERAVRTGLDIVDAVQQIPAPEPLRVRIRHRDGPRGGRRDRQRRCLGAKDGGR